MSWPPVPGKTRIPFPSGTLLGVDWSAIELRTLGNILTTLPCDPTRPGMAPEILRTVGVDPERADELAAAYRLGGTAALAQMIESLRVKP